MSVISTPRERAEVLVASVCREIGIDPVHVYRGSRTRQAIRARHAAVRAVYLAFRWTSTKLGSFFGLSHVAVNKIICLERKRP
jgi:hypothetical protein